MIDGTTFVLIDYGKHGATDLAFVETAVGTSFEDVLKDILSGQHEGIRGVYHVKGGNFIEATSAVAENLAKLPPDMLSQSARDFIDYCGFEVAEAAE